MELLSEYADTYIATRDFAAALKLVNRALAIRPGDPTAATQKVTIYQSLGDLTKAGQVVATLEIGTGKKFVLAPYFAILTQRLLTHQYQQATHFLRKILTRVIPSVPVGKPYGLTDLCSLERLAGRTTAAKEVCLNAQKIFRKRIQAGSSRRMSYYSYMGWAEALLGDKQAALHDEKKAISLFNKRPHAYIGPALVERLAKIEAWVGDKDDAIVLIQHLLKIPYAGPVTVALLRNDPVWDPLRDDPRFQVLVR